MRLFDKVAVYRLVHIGRLSLGHSDGTAFPTTRAAAQPGSLRCKLSVDQTPEANFAPIDDQMLALH